MASNPMLEAVLRFQHQQVTAPHQPIAGAAPSDRPLAPQDKPPFDPPLEKEEDEDEEGSEEEDPEVEVALKEE